VKPLQELLLQSLTTTKLEKTFKILGEKLRSYIKVPHSIAPKIKMKVLEAPGEGYFFYLELFRSGGVKAKKNP
jgi:hypothetical protein